MQNHIGADRQKKTLLDMLMCLCAMQLMAFYYYGYRTFIVSGLAVAVCCAVDFLFVYYRKRDIKALDISPVVTGLIFALLMPASIHYDILIMSCIIMMIIGKHAFGGVKNQVFNTAAVGYAFAYLCWRDELKLFPVPQNFGQLDLSSNVGNALEHSFTYVVDRVSEPSVSGIDIMLGRFVGPMGATHIVILSICAICLMCRRSISILTFFSSLSSILFAAFLFPPELRITRAGSLSYEFVSGAMLFCLIFIASDLNLVPKTKFARFFYGISIGIFTVVFRRFSGIEVPVVFAVIISNTLAGLFDDGAHGAANALKMLWKGIKMLPRLTIRFIKIIFRVLIRIPAYIKALIIIVSKYIEKSRERQKLRAENKAIAAKQAEESALAEASSVASDEPDEDNPEPVVDENAEEEPIQLALEIEPEIIAEKSDLSETKPEILIKQDCPPEIPKPLQKSSKKKSTRRKNPKSLKPVNSDIEAAEEPLQLLFDFDSISESPAELTADAKDDVEQPDKANDIKIVNVKPITHDKTLVEIELNPLKKKRPRKKPADKPLKPDTEKENDNAEK
ncbi:MAG: RnfABCDGE type electron transport complex subunit D [Oscillospiraceae bacterium]